MQNATPIGTASCARPAAEGKPAAPARPPGSRFRRTVEQALVLGALTLGFQIAPTLQGIALIADQSAGTSASIRAADAAASAEVVRLTATC